MNLTIEELSLSGWPALQTVVYDGWILRFAEGHTKRSNSVNPLYPSSIGIDEKIDECEAAYSARGLPTIFKILGCPEQASLDAALAERGYARIDETAVRTLELDGRSLGGEAAGAGPESRGGPARAGAVVSIESAITPAWIGGYCSCSRIWAKREIIGRMLANAAPGIAAASARDEGGGIVACGYGAIERGWVGIYDIVVKEERRRKGLGEAIMRSILGEAARRGAARAYLQVVSGNASAERLYGRLGFEEKYRYWYRRKD
jgi:GNAT superfamily N-acetyltransferase